MKSIFYYTDRQKWSVWLMATLLFLLPFELVPRFELLGATVRLSQLVAVALIAINLSTIWQTKRSWLKTPWLWLSGFIIVATLSSLFALSKQKAAMTTLFYAFDFILAYTVCLVFSAKQSELYKKVILAVSAAIVAFCLYQFFGDMFGLTPAQTLLSEKYSKLIFGFARVRGFSIEPLYLANYLIIPLCLALASCYFKPSKLNYWLSAIFMSTIWLTVARGAYLAVGLVLLILIVMMVIHKRLKDIAYLALLVVTSATVSFGLIWASGKYAKQLDFSNMQQTEFETNIPTQGISAEGNADRLLEHTTDFTAETSFTDRAKTAKTALELAKTHPIVGVGPGNFGRYVVKAYPQTFSDVNQISNNETLELLSELGGLGLIAIVGFAAYLFIYGLKYRFSDNNKENNIWFLATGLMLVAFVVQWQTFSTLYVTHIWVMTGVFLATTKNLRKIKTPKYL